MRLWAVFPRRRDIFSGHLLGSRVTSAVMDYMGKNDLVRNSRQQGELLLQGLENLQDAIDAVEKSIL